MKDSWIIFVCLLLFLVISNTYADPITDTNLVSWWSFDTNAGGTAVDYTGFNNGTITGAILLTTGIKSNDLNFSAATDNVDFNYLKFNPAKNFSINLWIKTLNSSANRLFTNFDGSTGLVIDCGGTNNAPRLLMQNSLKVGLSGAGNSCDTGNWRMITITYDGNSAKIYMDGVFAKDGVGANLTYGAGSKLRVGAWYANNQSYTGQVDEVSAWNRVLSASDISELWATGSALVPPFTGLSSSFTHSIDKNNQWVVLKDASSVSGGIITHWTWKLGDTNIGYTQDYNYSTSPLTDLNICLRVDSNTGLNSTSCQKFNTGDWNAPTTTFSSNQITQATINELTFTCADNNTGCKWTTFRINEGDWNTQTNTGTLDINYSGVGDHNIQYYSTDNADNNETIKFSYFPQFQTTQDQTNSRMIFTGTTIYNDYNITSWLWIVDGTPLSGTTDLNKLYSTQANLDLNVCLTTNSIDTTCKNVTTWDTIAPTIDANIVTSAFGFTTNFDINYNMICYDNFTPIQYTITWNNGTTDFNLYNSSDANQTLVTGTLDLNSSQNAAITFTCTDDSNNTATYTSNRLYAILFRLVNEATGINLTPTQIYFDFNIVRVYTHDGNYSFNAKDANSTTINFFSPSKELYFEIGYNDVSQTIINRQIDFSLITDSNIGVCVPLFQTFYQQRFVANSARQMVLQNNVSGCYVVASTLSYVYDTGYSITTYTIPKPYYLYIWVSGVKTFLALIDGAVATQYNLDAIAFSRTDFDIVVGQDTLGFAPLINTVTNQYDTNILQIYYKSYTQNNAQTNFVIKNGSSTIWNYTESSNANEFLINFYWGGLGINDENILELIVTTTSSNGIETSKSYYFTVYGNYYPNEGANGWVVIVATLFFLFGITLVAASRAFGIFGIIVCLICLGITATASGAWWISLIQAIFLMCLIYIIMMGRNTQGNFA